MKYDSQQLLTSSLKILSIRPHSEKEIRDFLGKKTPDTTLIKQTIEKLKSFKLLDDKKFTEWLIESRSRSRPRGQRLLDRELKAKGIDEMTINANRMTTSDEIALAQTALSKKQKIWSVLSARDYRLRATRYLQSRGFSWEAIEQAVKKGYNDIHVG